ncbi:cytochrome b562 [Acinetobacter sp. IK40]|jgi:soluble cytochrome b562|uniref:cytochrome b562 n=1 Tax=Acinetobacter sp. IK40 TaxID=2928897 RepID=UPI002D1F2600|nr:cytochrome b562 [Acinetobacter sp. IK40]MEB3792230.1 cytochrome b562 [Acinetobacter sp. IK40]
MKILIGFILSIILSTSCLAETSDRIYTVQNLEVHYKEFQASKDKYQALDSLFKMNNAILDLMEFLPAPLNQLQENDPKVIEYQDVMGKLLTEINEIKKLFIAGKFVEGKKATKDMNKLMTIVQEKYRQK